MKCTSSAFPDGSGQCGLDVGHAGNHRLEAPVKAERLDPITEGLIEKAVDAGIAYGYDSTDKTLEAASALRFRIAQLQQEAFRSGRDSVLTGQSQ